MRVVHGFTLAELVITLGIFILLLTIGFVGLAPSFSRTEVNTGGDILLSDFKSQQFRSMQGEGLPAGEAGGGSYGLTLFSDHYTLNPDNTVINLPAGVTLSTTFPGNTVTFSHGSGEIDGYTAGSSTITLTNGSITDVFSFNQYGVRRDP